MTKRPRPYYVLTHPQVGEQQGFHDNGTGGKNEGRKSLTVNEFKGAWEYFHGWDCQNFDEYGGDADQDYDEEEYDKEEFAQTLKHDRPVALSYECGLPSLIHDFHAYATGLIGGEGSAIEQRWSQCGWRRMVESGCQLGLRGG